jgi:hypothetical protein
MSREEGFLFTDTATLKLGKGAAIGRFGAAVMPLNGHLNIVCVIFSNCVVQMPFIA